MHSHSILPERGMKNKRTRTSLTKARKCLKLTAVMASSFTLSLAGGKTTDVFFLDSIKALSDKLSGYGRRVLWVFDSNSRNLFTSLPANCVILPSGEHFKNWSSVERIISAALDAHLARDSVFIGFGGGVVCDMTALAASLYMRGCSLVLVPTSLLCMVDASIGGKSAIDFKGAKNLVGTFYPAKDVLISAACLRTLPEAEYHSGLGEVIKHAFLSSDDELYSFLCSSHDSIVSRDREALTRMLELSLKVKAEYIQRDPEERKGIRQALNLAHTFAHALESIDNFNVKHGVAVAWGLSRAAWCGYAAGVTSAELRDRIDALLRLYDFDIDRRIERGRWLDFQAAVAKDKKNLCGTVRFVLLEDMGVPVLRELDSEIVKIAVISAPGRKNG